jgi:peptidoglycan/LPS O-acetylase OafA/YrhL
MFDPAIVEIILGGVLGLTVLGVTEVIKKFLKASGAVAYLISLAVSAGATAYYLISQHIFALVPFIGYTLFTFAVANGIFKATHTPTK